MSSPNMILPVGSQVRELDGKLLLACALAERGMPVIFGSHVRIEHALGRLPRGVYLAKGGNGQARVLEIATRIGHVVAAVDEESLIRGPDEIFWRLRVTPRMLAQMSVLFAWGEDDAQMFRGAPGNPGLPVHATGNPRFDFMRPELRGYHAQEVEALRKEYGDFLLLNTSFPGVNNIRPENSRQKRDAELGSASGRDPETQAQSEYRVACFEAVRAIVPVVARAFPDTTVVVRPHPFEDKRAWELVGRELSNVIVRQEGNVLPWIMGARAVLADNCTTLIETFLAGRPGIAFRPHPSRFEFDLPNHVSHHCFDHAAVVEHVRRALAGELQPRRDEEAMAHVRHHIAAQDGALAADRVADVIAQMGWIETLPPDQGWLQRIRGRVECWNRGRKQRAKHDGVSTFPVYMRQMFPTLDLANVEDRLQRLRHVTGRFDAVRVEPYPGELFRVRPA